MEEVTVVFTYVDMAKLTLFTNAQIKTSFDGP